MPGLKTMVASSFHGQFLGSRSRTLPSVKCCSNALRLSSLSSQANTSAPPATSAETVAVPAVARPTTPSFLSWYWRSAIISPQLQRRESDERQDGRDDPEADDDGGLL